MNVCLSAEAEADRSEGKENLKLSWKKRPDGNVFYPERKEDGF